MRHAAEHELAQARMAVAAHDDKIAVGIGDMCEDHVGDIGIAEHRALDLHV